MSGRCVLLFAGGTCIDSGHSLALKLDLGIKARRDGWMDCRAASKCAIYGEMEEISPVPA